MSPRRSLWVLLALGACGEKSIEQSKQTCQPPARSDAPAERLSATGCVDPGDPRKPAASVIPYDVQSALWSDGADKQRFLAVPDGALIHVKDCTREPATCQPRARGGTTEDEGHWQLPVGTVLVKSFLLAGKLLETRLFVRFSADKWVGYSYEWNDAQTEAAIVPAIGRRKDVGTQSWYFPSRNDCLECHNKTVGYSLGLETRQLKELDGLERLLDAPLGRLPALADYRDASATVEERARSYLHANCGTCHRPDGDYSDIDLRAGVPLTMMNICNVDPNKGNLDVPGAKRLAPAAPEKSLLVLRMQAPDGESGRMPQLATSLLDPVGIPLVSDWIGSISACPRP